MTDARLTPREKQRYEICKKQIADGLQTVFDTGTALMEVRDSKLYREEFETFEDFCQQTHKIGRSYAHRLIEAANIKEDLDLLPIGNKITNESQTRELSKVAPGEREAIIQAVVNKNGEVTAEAIRKEASKKTKPAIIDVSRNKPRQDAVQLSRVGQVIPVKIVDLWNRAEAESVELVTWAGKLKTAFKKAQDTSDIIWAEDSANDLFGVMMKVKWACKNLRPYAVCTECQGRTPDRCTFCRGRGFISYFRWGQVPQETKDIISKVATARK